MLEKLFGLKEHNTSVRRELVAGFHEFYDHFIYHLCATRSILSQSGLYGSSVPLCLRLVYPVQSQHSFMAISNELSGRISTGYGT